MQEQRETIVHYGKKLLSSGLTVGTGGNLSYYDPAQGFMAITPSGIDYLEMVPEDVVVADLQGNIVDGKLKPSSEFEMHAIVYRNRDDVTGMVHAHPFYSTTISCLRQPLPAIDYLVAHSGDKEVRCAEYATYGTKQLAENALKALGSSQAVLLANHGFNVVGKDLHEAFAVAEQIEFCARLYWQAKAIGEPVILPDEEMKMMVKRFEGYGQIRK